MHSLFFFLNEVFLLFFKIHGNYIYFYRVPLYYAVRRYDLQAVRLLLDFKADPNAIVKDVSLLSIAACKGFSEIVLMLLSAGANLNSPTNPPLLAVLSSGSKMCLSILLYRNNEEVLNKIDGNILLYHAAVQESSLLPVIANLTQNEIQKLKQKNIKASKIPSFPPKGLSSNQKKEINDLLPLNESLLSIESVLQTVKSIKKIWIPQKKLSCKT